MRLTLRTLLAYLDDVLEPAEAKEIGKKVQESPLATALIGRIREVMRRRRLGAADLDGPGMGIDPNLVAQYLDNTLPPEQVAEVEKICLESDQQLAEVAACHQILSIALGEPVEISPRHREKLYVLGPVEAGERLQAGTEAARNNGATAMKTPVSVKTIPGSAGPSFEESLPDYLKPKPYSGTFLTIAAGILLIAVWLGALYSDQTLWNQLVSLRPAPSAPATQVVAPEEGADVAVTENEEPAAEVAAADETPAKPPADTAPTEKPAEATVAVVEEPPVDALADLTVLAPADEPQPDVPQPLPPVVVSYVSAEGVLLKQHAVDKAWYQVPRDLELKPGSLVACPEPFEATLEFDQGALRLTLLGDSIMEVTGPDEVAPIGIRLIRGRIVLNVARREAKLWPLRFQIGPRDGVLQFGEFDTLCGLEFLPAEPLAFEKQVPLSAHPEGLYVLAGSVKWTPRDEPPLIVNKGVLLNLLSAEPPLSFGKTPDWLDPQGRKKSVLRRHAKTFEEEFELNEPIDSAMWTLVRDDPRPKISELAVRCLSLCDNYVLVVKGLTQTNQEDVRKAAITGIKQWLGADPARGELLIKALREFYEREEHVEILYRLLWGVSPQEATSPQVSEQLVDWLRSDKVEIRELAFANLVKLTDRTFGYQPLAAEPQRRPAIKRWTEFVLREGALVKPNNLNAPPPPNDPDAPPK